MNRELKIEVYDGSKKGYSSLIVNLWELDKLVGKVLDSVELKSMISQLRDFTMAWLVEEDKNYTVIGAIPTIADNNTMVDKNAANSVRSIVFKEDRRHNFIYSYDLTKIHSNERYKCECTLNDKANTVVGYRFSRYKE